MYLRAFSIELWTERINSDRQKLLEWKIQNGVVYLWLLRVHLIHAIRLLDSEMPLPQVHVLFLVAAAGYEGMSMGELCRKAEIGQASCSRYVSALGKQDRHREQGLGLVQATEDPLERRRKIVTLTTKGQGFINKVTRR